MTQVDLVLLQQTLLLRDELADESEELDELLVDLVLPLRVFFLCDRRTESS